jgi:hypothetical protein
VNRQLPWERLLWSGRPLRVRARLWGDRYYLTDFRLVCESRCCADEIALDDIGDVERTESTLDRVLGTSTVVVNARRDDRPPFIIADVRRGAQLAAVLELLVTDSRAARDPEALQTALSWDPRFRSAHREAIGAVAAVLIAIAAVVIGLHGRPIVTTYAADDAIRPSGVKRDTAAIVRFMERDVMPWARAVIGPLKGGANNVDCDTCHGGDAEARSWRMPAVAALPKPDFRERGWEVYSAGMDAQMRNAIYGYASELEKSTKAAYMREVVMPGMAALLHRAPYDFTRSYAYNQSRDAFGCYHCHRIR